MNLTVHKYSNDLTQKKSFLLQFIPIFTQKLFSETFFPYQTYHHYHSYPHNSNSLELIKSSPMFIINFQYCFQQIHLSQDNTIQFFQRVYTKFSTEPHQFRKCLSHITKYRIFYCILLLLFSDHFCFLS